ncbi:MAG TPA: carboxypeptidase-like regulatory domain-containing protein, partial [Bacteroidales bacterium]|nr:carboxypeptidase-like regulatory domain-containing protein [Bacteroidales bacterium]
MYNFLRYIVFLFFFFPEIVPAQEVMIRGTINDSIANEPLAGVSIVSMSDNTGTVSDSTGSFRLKISSGRKTLRFSLLGYKVIEREVAATSNISIKISMVTDVKQMEEVTVTAQNKQNQVKDISTGTFIMNRKEIDRLPVLLGETDYFKAIQLMPGIQSTGEGNAAIYVRGGAYDQN